MKDNLKEPCKECPFKKSSFAGWLGGISAQETNDMVLNEANFACHMTRHKKNELMSRCKGSQLFIINNCKVPKFNQALIDAVEKTRKEVKLKLHNLSEYLGFDFLKHHEKLK